jgi:tetratricopeptide (TPR) repeat protein
VIAVQLLGGFGVRGSEGEALSLATRKAEALLALLALRPGQAWGRDKLCGLLWPNVPDTQARHSLRQTLLRIRKGLDGVGQVLRADPGTVSLDAELVRVDVALLEQHIAQDSREALAQAATLYHGELLEGLTVDETPFQHWLTSERQIMLGHWRDALVSVERAAAAESERLQALAASARAHIYAGTLRWELAIEAAQHGLSLSKDPFTRVEALLTLAMALVGAGKGVVAQPLLHELTSQLHRECMVGWAGYTHIELAKLALHDAQPARAHALAQEALQIARTLSDANATASALRVRGLAALAQAEFAQARMNLTESLDLSNGAGARIESAHTHMALARLEQVAGDRISATRQFEAALRGYETCEVEVGCELARAALREHRQ